MKITEKYYICKQRGTLMGLELYEVRQTDVIGKDNPYDVLFCAVDVDSLIITLADYFPGDAVNINYTELEYGEISLLYHLIGEEVKWQ